MAAELVLLGQAIHAFRPGGVAPGRAAAHPLQVEEHHARVEPLETAPGLAGPRARVAGAVEPERGRQCRAGFKLSGA